MFHRRNKLACLFAVVIYTVGFLTAVHVMHSPSSNQSVSKAPASFTVPNLSEIDRGLKHKLDDAIGFLKDNTHTSNTPKYDKPTPPKDKPPPSFTFPKNVLLKNTAPDSPRQQQFVPKLPYSSPSCDPIENLDVSITLVTSTSMDRIDRLSEICSNWSGKLSIVFYTSLSTDEISTRVNLLPSCINQEDRITITMRAPTANEEADHSLFPVNELRNVAIQAVSTSHYFYVDIDFALSPKMFETMSNPKVTKFLASDYRHAVVIPAFERSYLTCMKSNEALTENEKAAFKKCINKLEMPTDMTSLKRMMGKRMTRVFESRWTEKPHGSTGYKSWFNQDQGSLRKIKCIDSNRYEPYVILRKCSLLPPFQEDFTGYGKNKVQHILHLRHLNYNFQVLGGAFLTHVPHPVSGARENWNEYHQKKKRKGDSVWGARGSDGENSEEPDFHRQKMDAIFSKFKTWLMEDLNGVGGEGIGTPLCEGASDDDSLTHEQ
mmetsp:Transcript_2163/g.4420  ORF Transcript_2163/g.4420 Transcript_2163/m.4420 type:complete len:490 (-) Transcript_2163:40-1509(-)